MGTSPDEPACKGSQNKHVLPRHATTGKAPVPMGETPPRPSRPAGAAREPGPVHGCALPGDETPDWPREFGRAQGEQILELEIGPGRGGFALDHAQAHPEIDLVAIETRRSDCEQIRSRARKRNLMNLAVLQGDGRLLVPRCFRPGQLAALHVQFPDPWWKKRHHKRRLVDVELAGLARTLLRAGGTVDFRTDVLPMRPRRCSPGRRRDS